MESNPLLASSERANLIGVLTPLISMSCQPSYDTEMYLNILLTFLNKLQGSLVS